MSGPANSALLTAGIVVALTFLFDLADLRPRIGSFHFVRTGTYLVYFLLRSAVALGAAELIAVQQPTLSPLLIGFGALLGGVILLQGFALNIAGRDVFNPASLISGYKDEMVAQELQRNRQERLAEILQTAERLDRQVEDTQELRRTCLTVLFQVYQVLQDPAGTGPDSAHQRVRMLLESLEQPYENDQAFRRRIYASLIAESNPDYTRQILAGQAISAELPAVRD